MPPFCVCVLISICVKDVSDSFTGHPEERSQRPLQAGLSRRRLDADEDEDEDAEPSVCYLRAILPGAFPLVPSDALAWSPP